MFSPGYTLLFSPLTKAAEILPKAAPFADAFAIICSMS